MPSSLSVTASAAACDCSSEGRSGRIIELVFIGNPLGMRTLTQWVRMRARFKETAPMCRTHHAVQDDLTDWRSFTAFDNFRLRWDIMASRLQILN